MLEGVWRRRRSRPPVVPYYVQLTTPTIDIVRSSCSEAWGRTFLGASESKLATEVLVLKCSQQGVMDGTFIDLPSRIQRLTATKKEGTLLIQIETFFRL